MSVVETPMKHPRKCMPFRGRTTEKNPKKKCSMAKSNRDNDWCNFPSLESSGMVDMGIVLLLLDRLVFLKCLD